MLSPLTTQEAVLSSQIEGTQASMEEVLKYEADPKGGVTASKHADIQEIINYRHAMRSAISELKKRPLCLNLLKKLHYILLDSVRGQSKGRGEFRRSQNFIGPVGCTIENATFVPPAWGQVGESMGNWEKYLHFDEKDRLVQLTIVKAQFELIHPFLDGNGRLGRMLVPTYLYEKGLLSSPMFYISAYLEMHRDKYYEKLRAISREGDWNGWVKFFLTAIVEQAGANTTKVRGMQALYDRVRKEVSKIINSHYIIHAVDPIFEKPIFLSANFIRKSGIPKASAIRILNAFKKAKLIRDLRPGRGSRGAIMIFPELLKITEGR